MLPRRFISDAVLALTPIALPKAAAPPKQSMISRTERVFMVAELTPFTLPVNTMYVNRRIT